MVKVSLVGTDEALSPSALDNALGFFCRFAETLTRIRMFCNSQRARPARCLQTLTLQAFACALDDEVHVLEEQLTNMARMAQRGGQGITTRTADAQPTLTLLFAEQQLREQYDAFCGHLARASSVLASPVPLSVLQKHIEHAHICGLDHRPLHRLFAATAVPYLRELTSWLVSGTSPMSAEIPASSPPLLRSIISQAARVTEEGASLLKADKLRWKGNTILLVRMP